MPSRRSAAETLTDVARVYPVAVKGIFYPTTEQEISEIVKMAISTGAKISVGAVRHSQGAQTLCQDGYLVDMRCFNKVLSVDADQKTVRVQSGATWNDVQHAIHPFGLVTKVQQVPNMLSVGGAVSANIHGRDPHFGTVVETVRSVRLLLADGTIQNVSRTMNPELFSLVVGGFGLFGILLEIELDVMTNTLLQKTTVSLDYAEYIPFLKQTILKNPRVDNHVMRPSIRKKDFLKHCVAAYYTRLDDKPSRTEPLAEENLIFLRRSVVAVSRKFAWGRDFRWLLQGLLLDRPGATPIVSRMKLMRPDVKFLDYYSKTNTDIGQTYFVPLDSFVDFMDGMRKIFIEHEVNLFNLTVRYVPKESEKQSFLKYAHEPMISVPVHVNQGLSAVEKEKAQKWTRALVDLAINLRGSYYLTYQTYPSFEQIRRAYPMIDDFFLLKSKYDPEALFSSQFYEEYRPRPLAKVKE